MEPETKTTRKQNDVIEVDKSLLKTILSKVEGLEKSVNEKNDIISQLKEDNEKLLAVADKKRIADYEVKNNKGGSLVKRVRVWTMEDKVITSWKMVVNKVIANLHRNTVDSEQTIRVVFLKTDDMKDGENEAILTYKTFIDSRVPVEGDVIKVVSDEDNTVYHVQFDDGRIVEVNVKYIN